MFLILFVLIFLAWFGVFRYKRRRMYELAARLYTSKGDMPFIVLPYKLMGNSEEIMSAFSYFSEIAMNNNGIVRGWLGHILYVLITDPDDLEVVLKTCLEKDDLHRFIKQIVGNGGIFAPVAIWRNRRKITIPAFSPKVLETFVDIFSKQSDKLATLLNCRDQTGKFSAWPAISSYTLDSVCETVLGVKINSQSNPDTPFVKSLDALMNIVCKRMCSIWLHPDWLFRLFPYYKEQQYNANIIHAFIDKVIENKRKDLQSEKYGQDEHEENDKKSIRRQTFLDLFIKLSGDEEGYNNVELREEVMTLVIAGTDSTAIVICNTLKLLAKYPDVQQKVYEELYDVFGESHRLLVKEDLWKLSYLERVVKESLRLYPPGPILLRKVLEEIKLPSGRILPAGCGVAVSIWGAHRDPKYWGPDAEKFDPDRFLPERFKLSNTCSYMPFSSGPRNCVAQQYALISLKTVISTLLRRYRVVPEPESSATPQMRLKLEIMMKDADGYQIALEPRKHYAAGDINSNEETRNKQ